MSDSPRSKRTAPRKLPTVGTPAQRVSFDVPRGESLGLHFAGHYSEDGTPLGVHVDNVIPGSIAALSGKLGEGDRILRVNRSSLTGLELDRARELLRRGVVSGHVELEIIPAAQARSPPRKAAAAATPSPSAQRRKPSVRSANPAFPSARVIELPQHPQGLGITVVASDDRLGRQLIIVSSIRDAGVIPLQGGLHVGDAILSVNGLSLVDQPGSEVTRRLQAVIGPSQLQERVCQIDTKRTSLGISFAEDAKGHVRVAAIVPGSPGDNGQVKEGMEIVSLNGETIDSVQQLKRMVLRLNRNSGPLRFHLREGRAVLEVIPQVEVTTSGKSTPDSTSKRSNVSSRNPSRNPRASLATLLDTIEASHQPMSARQRQQVIGLCQPDEDGLVTRRQFQVAYEAVMKTEGVLPRDTSAMSIDFESDDDTAQMTSQRAKDQEIRTLKKKLQSANQTIDRLQREKEETGFDPTNTHRQAQQLLEQNYDEIVALLEAEIAHLRAQLVASSDEKDQQLINLRRRCLVLGVQLNKAVAGRRALEVAFEKLRDFANRTLRRLLLLSMYGPRFADKKLAMATDNTLLYRPSDGMLPPTASWAVGDVCRVTDLETGKLAAAIIESFEEHGSLRQTFVQVRLLQYDDVPVVQQVPLTALQPLSEEDFAVEAARGGLLSQKAKAVGTDMTKTENEIDADCRKVLEAISVLLDDEGVLPFGWEEAYTADGLKYYVDHTTQTTSWVHPTSRIDKAMNSLSFIDASQA